MGSLMTQLEIAEHIANRGSKALVAIESISIRISKILQSESSAEDKVERITHLNKDIFVKVMEGTSSLYEIEKK
jgi:hypothetical protein